MKLFFSLLVTATLLVTGYTQAEQAWLKPYVMVKQAEGTIAEQAQQTRAALEAGGFEVVGEYQPYAAASVLIATNAALRKAAAGSEFGGYGSGIRVAMTQQGGKVQVSYVNPAWMAASYHFKGDLAEVSQQLSAALGAGQFFGAEDPGWKADQLDEFHFTVFMPYFDDHVELAEHDSYDTAVKVVEAGLAAGKGGTSKVFRIDVPGKKETLFGVALNEKSGVAGDAHIMGLIDNTELKQTAHLPYGILVSGGNIYAQHAKFRIANNFPDLDMSTFFKISDAPDAIEEALKMVATGK